MADYRTIKAEKLTSVIHAIAKAGGSTDREAELVSTNLVEANLKGHDSHGVGMIPRYAEAVAEGGLAVNQHVKIVMDTGPLLTLDGLTGYGQVMGHEAMELGAERAKRNGVCVVGLSNSHHIGRIGHWAEQCIEHGLVSIHFVNVISRPIVAPWGGSDARHGTNPFCVGIPREGHEPIVLDFATSKIAQGKTRVAYNKGVALEPGTIIDNEGRPTTNPRYTVIAPHGAILPFGEHKGSGLALVCEILGGALSGGQVVKGPADNKRRVLNGMLSIPAPGVDKVKIAGEPERETKKKRLAEGIPVDPNTWQEILDAGKRFGLDQATIEKIVG
jgi:hydroxycarboxylate dehydrogenase B